MKKLLFCLFLIAFPLHAAAPPSQKCDAGGSVNNAASSCNLPVASTVGDLVVALVYIQSSTITITSMSGANTWHIIGPKTGTGNESYITWAVITTGESSVVANLSNFTRSDMSAAEYTGMAAVGTVADCNSAGLSGNSTSLDSGSCTPTAGNDLIVAVGGSMANSITYTAGGSYTIEESQAHSTQGNSYAFEDVNSASCASQNATLAASGSAAQWTMIMAAFKTSAPSGCGGGSGGKMMKLERYE